MSSMNKNLIKCERNKLTKIAFSDTTVPANSFAVKLPHVADEDIIILLQNNSGGEFTITVKKPEKGGPFAAAADESISLKSSDDCAFRFESARWANHDGTIHFELSTDKVNVAVLY